jgi:signal recognition particle receptor subunit beta
VLAFGDTGVGKTTLWHYLEHNRSPSPDTIRSTESATDIGGFRLKYVKLVGVKTKLIAVDLPGQVELRHTWAEVLTRVRPQGIFFMLDHAKDATAPLPESGFDRTRLKAHAEAFRQMRELILDNDDVKGHLHAISVLVNKQDRWPRDLNYGRILDESGIPKLYDRFAEIDVSITANGCSALHGENVTAVAEWMVKHAR